jgi:hypothetical protein
VYVPAKRPVVTASEAPVVGDVMVPPAAVHKKKPSAGAHPEAVNVMDVDAGTADHQ